MNARWYWVVALAMMSLAPVMTHSALVAGKPAGQTPSCRVTFSDQSTYKITSDHHVPPTYTDGVDSVSCQVGGPNSENIDLVLSSKHTTRRISGLFTAPVLPTDPSYGLITSNYMTIQQVAHMTPGTTKMTNAHYLFNGNSWSLNWCGGSAKAAASATSHPWRCQ